MTSSPQPRVIDPAKTFESIVKWIEKEAVEQHAPGLIVGISGTDSILTYLVCAKAFENLGKPSAVLGVNFEHSGAKPKKGIPCISSEFNWVSRDIFPWLKQKAPLAQLELDDTIPVSDDNKRWGNLFSRAVRDTARGSELTSRFYFPVGTRNATEEHLGAYTQISKAVSMLPLVDLFKSEVLEICEYLGVPQIAIDKSREIDCDCGRFDIQANHMRELDLVIMAKTGVLDKTYLRTIPPKLLRDVVAFYVEERVLNEFRHKTPYRPQQSLVITR